MLLVNLGFVLSVVVETPELIAVVGEQRKKGNREMIERKIPHAANDNVRGSGVQMFVFTADKKMVQKKKKTLSINLSLDTRGWGCSFFCYYNLATEGLLTTPSCFTV